MTEKPGIYVIRCRNGKVYVGSASNISKRWSRHRHDLRLNRHSNQHLQAAWNLYGEDAFTFEVLEFTSGDLAELTAREQHWIDQTGCADPRKGYNTCPLARTSRGRPVTLWMWAANRTRKRPKGVNGYGISLEPVRGEDNPSARLTEEQVREIKARYGVHTPRGRGRHHARKGGVTMGQLAREYGVKPMAVSDILNGKTWRHVQ